MNCWESNIKRRSVLQGYELEYGQWRQKYTWSPCKLDTCGHTKRLICVYSCQHWVFCFCLRSIFGAGSPHPPCSTCSRKWFGYHFVSQTNKQTRTQHLFDLYNEHNAYRRFRVWFPTPACYSSRPMSDTHTRRAMFFTSFLVRPIQLCIQPSPSVDLCLLNLVPLFSRWMFIILWGENWPLVVNICFRIAVWPFRFPCFNSASGCFPFFLLGIVGIMGALLLFQLWFLFFLWVVMGLSVWKEKIIQFNWRY